MKRMVRYRLHDMTTYSPSYNSRLDKRQYLRALNTTQVILGKPGLCHEHCLIRIRSSYQNKRSGILICLLSAPIHDTLAHQILIPVFLLMERMVFLPWSGNIPSFIWSRSL